MAKVELSNLEFHVLVKGVVDRLHTVGCDPLGDGLWDHARVELLYREVARLRDVAHQFRGWDGVVENAPSYSVIKVQQ